MSTFHPGLTFLDTIPMKNIAEAGRKFLLILIKFIPL